MRHLFCLILALLLPSLGVASTPKPTTVALLTPESKVTPISSVTATKPTVEATSTKPTAEVTTTPVAVKTTTRTVNLYVKPVRPTVTGTPGKVLLESMVVKGSIVKNVLVNETDEWDGGLFQVSTGGVVAIPFNKMPSPTVTVTPEGGVPTWTPDINTETPTQIIDETSVTETQTPSQTPTVTITETY